MKPRDAAEKSNYFFACYTENAFILLYTQIILSV